MRILMLTPAFHPLAGGVERHVRRVSEELVALGHEVAVVTRSVPGAPALERVGEIDVVRVVGGLRAVPNLWRRHRGLFRVADVIHCHDAYPFLSWHLPLRRVLGLGPAHVTFHGYEAYPPPREAVMRRRWVRRLCAGALGAGGFIPKWYGTPCDAITYGGVDAPPALPEGDPEPRAVFVGRLEKDTGILDYLRMLVVLRAKHGLVIPLDVCGDGSLRSEAERVAITEGLPVRLHGRVPDPSCYLTGARFALVGGYLAMWEAMAAGALVVALYDNPLKRDYLECFPPAAQDGPVSVCGSAEEGAARLAHLAARPEEMHALALSGRECALRQTWRRVAGQYLALWGSGTGEKDDLGCSHSLE